MNKKEEEKTLNMCGVRVRVFFSSVVKLPYNGNTVLMRNAKEKVRKQRLGNKWMSYRIRTDRLLLEETELHSLDLYYLGTSK